jgi:hypothetical protein
MSKGPKEICLNISKDFKKILHKVLVFLGKSSFLKISTSLQMKSGHQLWNMMKWQVTKTLGKSSFYTPNFCLFINFIN